MKMAKSEFNEIHEKIDKILEISNNTNVRLSVVETKLNCMSSNISDNDKTVKDFMKETRCQREKCSTKFEDIDSSLDKAQGAIWMIGFFGVIVGIIGGCLAILAYTGYF